MAERVYLTLEDVLFLHTEQIRLFGGADGVRDAGLILLAILRPQTGYYSDLLEETAALWESLAMNHGFIDGNKRVAFAAMLIFLGANGLRLIAEPDDIIAFICHHLEAGSFRKDILDAWLRHNTEPL